MLDIKVKNFLEEIYNNEIEVDDMPVNRENFLFAMGYFYQFCREISVGTRKGNALTHHMRSMEQAINYVFKCYKEVNSKMNYGCIWQKKLLYVVSTGSVLYKETELTESDQNVIVQGMCYPLRTKVNVYE